MPRPRRKKLKFNDEDSMNMLLQEIYDDTHNIRAQIKRLYTKWETKVKEEGHIAALGDQIIKLIGAEAKNQDQKIMLLKYLKDMINESKGGAIKAGSVDEDEKGEITTDRRNELINMVEEEMERKKKDK